jgi:hypothetical protein
LNIYEYIQYCEALEIDPSIGLEILKTKKWGWSVLYDYQKWLDIHQGI